LGNGGPTLAQQVVAEENELGTMQAHGRLRAHGYSAAKPRATLTNLTRHRDRHDEDGSKHHQSPPSSGHTAIADTPILLNLAACFQDHGMSRPMAAIGAGADAPDNPSAVAATARRN
jgi:hypothetical protein